MFKTYKRDIQDMEGMANGSFKKKRSISMKIGFNFTHQDLENLKDSSADLKDSIADYQIDTLLLEHSKRANSILLHI